MTNIQIIDDGKYFKLSIEGHSGYAAQGHDIVCAGISALAFSFLRETQILSRHLRNYNYEVENGKFSLEFLYTRRHPVRTAIQMVTGGLFMIQEQYPQYVNVKNDTQRCEKKKMI